MHNHIILLNFLYHLIEMIVLFYVNPKRLFGRFSIESNNNLLELVKVFAEIVSEGLIKDLKNRIKKLFFFCIILINLH